jgi:hypothetical protein
MLKTLKQFLEEKCDECAGICEEPVKEAVKEWLTQKRLTSQYNPHTAKLIIDELLEEFKQ